MTMTNERARKIQNEIVAMANRNMTSRQEEVYEGLCASFESALSSLPPEGKRLGETGFLIHWIEERSVHKLAGG